jgi:alpha-tubulin suppressor-like RCC1 family protein
VGHLGGLGASGGAVALVVALSSGSAHAGPSLEISVGDEATCGNAISGAWCAGRNDRGQMGDGSTVERHVPWRVATNTDSVYVGDADICILRISSWWPECAGANDFGQLGDGTTTERHTFLGIGPDPNRGGNVFRVSVGNTSCYSSSGTWCWGSNQFGAVGDGTTTDQLMPVEVSADLTGVDTSGATGHTCAIRSSTASNPSSLWCWGNNADDALGAGPGLGAFSATPLQVTALGNNVKTVSTGVGHTCATLLDGTLWCWGHNDRGQLGDGTTVSRGTPAQVTAFAGAATGVSVSRSGEFTCATNATAAFCWGRNDRGQLGDGTTVDRSVPTAVAQLTGSMQVHAGENHACSQAGGSGAPSYFCWGANDHGQLGDGTTDEQHQPVAFLIGAAQPPAPVPSAGPVALALLIAAVVFAASRRIRR